MRKASLVLASFVILGSLFLSCKKEEVSTNALSEAEGEKEILYWTCGMHPSVRVSPEEYEKSRPKCPICNMDLVPVYEETSVREGVIPTLTLSSYAEKLAGVRTDEVAYRRLVKEITTAGKIDYDERKVAHVAARVGGRIDKLHVDFRGIRVKKGEPLASIYSPELVSTQEEYLLALETLHKLSNSHIPEVAENAKSLVESTKRRLLLWGIPEREIQRLEQEQKASIHMTIYSPIDGTVVGKSVLEGKYVKEGDHLYTVAELSNVWMFADIYEYEMSWLRLGQEVEVTTPAYPGETFVGTITFVDPVLHPETRSVRIRADFANPHGKLKPEMFVKARIRIPVTREQFPEVAGLYKSYEAIEASLSEVVTYRCDCTGKIWSQEAREAKSCPYCGEAMPDCGSLVEREERREVAAHDAESFLAIPVSSLLDTGTRKVVYVDKSYGNYEIREVKTGPQAGEYYPIVEGVDEGERVVVKANFLIDSQSQLTGPAAAMYDAAIGRKEEHRH
jgi:RND family efflux transporter MFP subunit